ncbi:MAG: hypothetical protein ABSD70_18440 [Terracidiphilus sp.]
MISGHGSPPAWLPMMGVMTVMAEHLHSFQSTGNRAALSNQFFAADESLTARRSTVMASFAAPS